MSAFRRAGSLLLTISVAILSSFLLSGCADGLASTLKNLYIVDNPIFNPPPGNYGDDIDIEMTTATQGAEIWYTTDGSEPSQGGGTSTRYTAPLPVSPPDGPVRYFARAFRENMTPSGEAIGAFSVTYSGPTTPTLQVIPLTDAVELNGVWTGAVRVQVNGDPANDSGNLWNASGYSPTVHYTLDGTLPNAGSPSVDNGTHNLITVSTDGSDVVINALTIIQADTDYPFSPAATERVRMRFADRAADPVITAEDGSAAPSVLWGEFTLKISNNGSEDIVVEQQTNGGAWSIVSSASSGDQLVTLFSNPGDADVVNIRAWAEGDPASELGSSNTVTASFNYVNGVLSSPDISPQTGQFPSQVTITMTTDVVGADIYYTTDGTPPTTASLLYNSEITINGATDGYGGHAINAITAYIGAVSSVRSAYVEVLLP